MDEELLKDLEQLEKQNQHLREFYEAVKNVTDLLDIESLLFNAEGQEEDHIRNLEIIQNLVREYQLQ